MAFEGYTIDSPVAATCISQDGQDNVANDITYGENILWSGGTIIFSSYMKSVSGVQQIFVNKSYTGGETWETPEQVTTGGYNKYGSSCCMDINGTGLHLVYSAKGHGAVNQRPQKSMVYRFRDADGVWSAETVIEQAGIYTWHNATSPSIAIDSAGYLHVSYSWAYNSGYFGGAFQGIGYKKYNGASLLAYAYMYYGPYSANLFNQNIQVDYYGNPHLVFNIRRPTAAFGANVTTTAWIVNLQQGHIDGWPGTRLYGNRCFGYLNEAINCHVLCTKSLTGDPFPDPEERYSPSLYKRLAHSHSLVEGNNYYDGVNEYDYPHCVYNFNAPGTIYTIGTYYTWKDDSGWHDELISLSPSSSPSPSIAINPDGKIHTVIPEPVNISSGYDYRQRTTYNSAWSSKISVVGLTAPRQLFQRYPIQYPMDDMQCSPFMAVQDNALKFFKCADIVTGYGYFM